MSETKVTPTKPVVYVFGYPSLVGGAGTKLWHLLRLMQAEVEFVVVPNEEKHAREPFWKDELRRLGVRTLFWRHLPKRLSGWALAMCNRDVFNKGLAVRIKQRGLKLAWSNDMMWHFDAELGALLLGWIDKVLYVSPNQRAVLEPEYLLAVSRLANGGTVRNLTAHRGTLGGRVPWVMTGNYVDPASCPFLDRFSGARGRRTVLRVGRVSRPDPMKYPDHFPAFMEGLGLRKAKFRIMGWSEKIAAKWPEHHFRKSQWELLPTAAQEVSKFLHSLDLFIYSTSPQLRESWGRAPVEAMLTGCIPLVSKGAGHFLEALIPHDVGGFLCGSDEEFGEYARKLERDRRLRKKMSFAGRQWALDHLCDAETHRRLWREVFEL